VLGALVTVFSTWATVDCAGKPDPGAELDGVVLEVAEAGAELWVELEELDTGVDRELAVCVGAVEPFAEEDELGVDVPLLTTPPLELEPGDAPAASDGELACPSPRTGCDPVGAPIATRVARGADSSRWTPGAFERGAWARSAVLIR
jgi:hypothetical protein